MGRIRESFGDAWNSRATKLAAFGVLGIVGVIAVVAILLSIFAPVNPGGQNAEPTSSPSTAPTTRPETDGCDAPTGDTSGTPPVPNDLRWEAEQGVTWPVSDKYGPTSTKDGHGVCFARSPLGAALLLATMMGATSQADGTVDDFLFYIADSSGKEAFAAEAASFSGAGSDLQSGRASLAGFRTVSFTPDEAQVALVMTAPGTATGYIEGYFTLAWVEGDWRIRVLSDGQFAPVPYAAVVEGGFVDWRAE